MNDPFPDTAPTQSALDHKPGLLGGRPLDQSTAGGHKCPEVSLCQDTASAPLLFGPYLMRLAIAILVDRVLAEPLHLLETAFLQLLSLRAYSSPCLRQRSPCVHRLFLIFSHHLVNKPHLCKA